MQFQAIKFQPAFAHALLVDIFSNFFVIGDMFFLKSSRLDKKKNYLSALTCNKRAYRAL